MNILIDFIAGLAFGLEVPDGEGWYLIIYLGPLRVGFASDEAMNEYE